MRKRIINVVLTLMACLIIFIGYYYLNGRYGFSIPCPFHNLTGYYCPGCGITRCLFAILNLEFYKAFMYNQLVFIMLPFLIFLIIYRVYVYILDKQDILIKKIPSVVWIIILIIVIGFGFIRNVSYFGFLRP